MTDVRAGGVQSYLPLHRWLVATSSGGEQMVLLPPRHNSIESVATLLLPLLLLLTSGNTELVTLGRAISLCMHRFICVYFVCFVSYCEHGGVDLMGLKPDL